MGRKGGSAAGGPNFALNQNEIAIFPDMIPVVLVGAVGIGALALFGYFWSGRKNAEEIRAEKKQRADKAKQERTQKQQMFQQLQGQGGDPSQFAPPNVDTNELSRINEFQKNLSFILQAANVQYSKGQYDKALQLYQEGLKMIPPNIPQYDTFALEITPKLITCYLETNKVKEANEFLMNLKPLLSKNPETVLSLNVIRAQVLDALNSDVELEKLLLENIDSSQRLFGSNSVKYINQLYSYGTFLVKKQKYRQAIEKFKECLAFHSSTGVAPSQEEFGIYRQIQRCHLLLDEKEEALQLLERIKLLTEDPITVAWQMHHTATLLLETNFNEDAEGLFQEILEDFPIPPKGEFDVPRIKSLVSNTVSEYAMYLYNIGGRLAEAEKYLDLIKLYKWGVLSSSVFLVAKLANIYFAPKGDANAGFIAKINCEFLLAKRVKKGMVIDFETEIEGKDSASVEIEEGQISAKFSGKEVTKIENKIYTVTAKIYSDKSRSELLFTHFQFVPSSIDTRNMKTWKDIEEGFKAAKRS